MTSESNGLTGNGELEQVADGNNQLPIRQLPIEAVDALADELVAEYNNPGFRVWYCGVIYQFGFEQVAKWRLKAANGRTPGGLFGHYVKQVRATVTENAAAHKQEQPQSSGVVSNTADSVSGDETDEELSKNIDQTLREMEQSVDISAWDNATDGRTAADSTSGKAIPWMNEDG
jgi:hypothetical protein